MPRATVRIVLDDRAYALALRPADPEVAPLHPAARAALEDAEMTAGTPSVRVVRCTVPEARALLDYFDLLCARLITLRDDAAAPCARARDIVRRALVAAGA
jgi:hypothetical protein